MSGRFRYVLPTVPVAGAAVEIGRVAVTIELLLTGELDVVANRDAALTALAELTKGLTIRGLGSATARISAPAGHLFTQRRQDVPEPGTVTYAGDCTVDFTSPTVTVSGNVGYTLTVTTAGRSTSDTRFAGELGAIGLVLLVGTPMGPDGLSACGT